MVKWLELNMLRPVFTKQLADTLLAGHHVNLVSLHGRGRRQTLLDVVGMFDGIEVRKIDLKREQNKWESWLEKTLGMDGQIIVIIHNIEHATAKQMSALQYLKRFTLLCVSERPIADASMKIIALPPTGASG